MSHPKICPCPNCLVRAPGGGLFAAVVGLALVAAAVVYLSRLSAFVGRGPMVAALAGAFVLVAVVIGAGIRGSLRSSRGAAVDNAEPRALLAELAAGEPERAALVASVREHGPAALASIRERYAGPDFDEEPDSVNQRPPLRLVGGAA